MSTTPPAGGPSTVVWEGIEEMAREHVRAYIQDLLEEELTEYGVTSLSPRQAGAEKLMLLMRRHWHVENRNHHVRDDGWREDRQTWRGRRRSTTWPRSPRQSCCGTLLEPALETRGKGLALG
ncbi:MAG: transposase [Planctomycetota bacterium]